MPAPIALLTFIPLAPTIVTLAVEASGLGEFGRLYGQKVRFRDYARLILGTFPYQIFLGLAAVRSVFREWKGDHSWEKTEHTGAHRTDEVAETEPVSVTLPAATPELVLQNGATR